METLKKILCVSGNGNPRKLPIFWEMELLSPTSKKKTKKKKKFLNSEKMKLSGSNIKTFFVFLSKEIFFMFCEHKPEKNPSISGSRTLLYFSKRKPQLNSLYFRKLSFLTNQEMDFIYSYIFLKKVFLVFQERYIQTSGTFRTRSIFRTLEYLELQSFS